MYDILESPGSSIQARLVFLVLMSAIVASVINWHVSTLVKVVRSSGATSVSKAVEDACTIVFLIEMSVRFFVSTFDLYNMLLIEFTFWMDIFAVAPNVIEWIAGEGFLPSDLKEGAALLRLLRILKLMRHYADWKVLLMALRRAFRPLLVPMVAMFLSILLLGGAMWIFERNLGFIETLEDGTADGPHDEGFANAFETLWGVFWLVMTLGFDGHIGSGRSVGGRLVVCAALISGLLFTTMPITIVGDAFIEAWTLKRSRQVEVGLRQLLLDRKLSATDLGKIFDEFDSSGNGSLDLTEFKGVLKTLGLFLEPAEANKVFRHFDANETGSIDFEEFCWCIFGKSVSDVSPNGASGPNYNSAGPTSKPACPSEEGSTEVRMRAASEQRQLSTGAEQGYSPDHPASRVSNLQLQKLGTMPSRVEAIEKSLLQVIASMEQMREGQRSLHGSLLTQHVENVSEQSDSTTLNGGGARALASARKKKIFGGMFKRAMSTVTPAPQEKVALTSRWPDLVSDWRAVQAAADACVQVTANATVNEHDVEARVKVLFENYLTTVNYATIDMAQFAPKREEFRAQALQELSDARAQLSELYVKAEAAVSALAAHMPNAGEAEAYSGRELKAEGSI